MNVYVRLIPGMQQSEAILIIRKYTGYALKEAKDILDTRDTFPVEDTQLYAFAQAALACSATVVISKDVPSRSVLAEVLVPAIQPMMAKLTLMQHELAGLRKHLGLLAHE